MNNINKQEEAVAKLIERKFITKDDYYQIEADARIKNKTFFNILVEKKIIDQEELAKLIAEIYKLPYDNLFGKKISNAILRIIPIEVSENYKIICYGTLIDDEGEKIKIGIIDPSDFKALEAINFLARKESIIVEYNVISANSYNYAFKQYKNIKDEVNVALQDKLQEEDEEEKSKDKTEETEEVIKSAPVAKIVSVIIRHAIEGNASDIHIEPLESECRIRYRIDGILHTSLTLPKNVHDSLVSRIKVLANLKLDETRMPQDGRIRLPFGNRDYDFRVSVLPLVGDEKVVMRILDTNRGAPSLEDLGFSGFGLEVIKKNIKDSTGILLVTGPTGSGKSTTLFSLLNILNEEGMNISTLEDPVEYFVRGVNQSQIKPEIGFTFASGLRSLLRQDPDIIMVGEIRDNETAELAIHSALTGHFILSTLHTNDAIGAIPRLMDMHVEPFLLISTLNTIVAQRLGRKICSHCRIEDKITENMIAEIKGELSKVPKEILSKLPDIDLNNIKFYKGKGCPRCGNTGYWGRVGVVEVIDINDKLKDLILSGKRMTQEEIIASQPFITMKQDGYLKVLQGMTSYDEILRILQD